MPIGDILADFTGGVWSDMQYKNLSFSALVDFQKGGSVHSYSNQWGKYSGTLAETAEGTIREDGVVLMVFTAHTMWMRTATSAPSLTWMPTARNADGPVANETTIAAQDTLLLNQGYVIHAADQYDASFVKLRER